ncbi:MAG: hypothetical protein IPJ65_08610 [Archangiaceae bacterium]|nr:hypothetical protein [Archangiaceae bacterium]
MGSPRAVVVASFLDEAPTAKIDDGFVNGFLLGMLKKKPPKGITLRTHHRWQEVQLARGAAREARVDLPEVVGPVRARLIPLCGGRAAFYVVGVPLEPEGSADIDAAFEALQGPDGEPPLCAEK